MVCFKLYDIYLLNFYNQKGYFLISFSFSEIFPSVTSKI